MRKARLYLVVLFCLASGCDEPAKPVPVEKVIYINNFGQSVDEIAIGEWFGWLNDHKNCRIVTLTAVARSWSDSNPTSNIIVVYEEGKP